MIDMTAKILYGVGIIIAIFLSAIGGAWTAGGEVSAAYERIETLEENDEKIDAKLDKLDAKIDAKFDKLDAKIDAKFDKLDAKIDAKIDNLDAKIDAKIDNFIDRIDERRSKGVHLADH